MIITDLEVQAARDQAEAAEREYAEAERQAMGRSDVDDVTAARLTKLSLNARHLRAKVDDLVSRRDAQRRELEERAARESGAAKAIAAAERELAASRQILAESVEAAEEALRGAASAARAHDELVAHHRAVLLDRGLRLDDVDSACDHQTGAAVGLSSSAPAGLRVRGRFWQPIEPASVLAFTAQRAATGALGQQHPVTMGLAGLAAVRGFGAHPGGLLALPDVKPAPVRRPRAPEAPKVRPEPLPPEAMAPYLVRVERERLRLGGTPRDAA